MRLKALFKNAAKSVWLCIHYLYKFPLMLIGGHVQIGTCVRINSSRGQQSHFKSTLREKYLAVLMFLNLQLRQCPLCLHVS